MAIRIAADSAKVLQAPQESVKLYPPARSLSREFNRMRIRDAHSHFFSRRFCDLLAGQAAQSGGGRAEELLERVTASGVELPDPSPRLHARRWVEQLDLHGVAPAVTFGSHPAEAEAVAEGCAEAGGRLTPFVLVDPSTEAGL